MMLNIFSWAYFHLYIFFGEVFKKKKTEFFEFWEFFRCLKYTLYVSYKF